MAGVKLVSLRRSFAGQLRFHTGKCKNFGWHSQHRLPNRRTRLIIFGICDPLRDVSLQQCRCARPGRQDNIAMASSKLPGTAHSQQPPHRAIRDGGGCLFCAIRLKSGVVLPYRQHASCRMKSRSDFTLQEANMGRQADRERTQQIAGFVEQHPGVRPAEIATTAGGAIAWRFMCASLESRCRGRGHPALTRSLRSGPSGSAPRRRTGSDYRR